MAYYDHQGGEYHRQKGARQLVDLDHLPSPDQNAFKSGTTLFRSIEFRPTGEGYQSSAARASILPATGSCTALR
jgi:hypothetical protein